MDELVSKERELTEAHAIELKSLEYCRAPINWINDEEVRFIENRLRLYSNVPNWLFDAALAIRDAARSGEAD